MSRAKKSQTELNPILEAMQIISSDEIAYKLGISKVHLNRMSKQSEISLQISQGLRLIIENHEQKKEIDELKKEIEILRSLLKS